MARRIRSRALRQGRLWLLQKRRRATNGAIPSTGSSASETEALPPHPAHEHQHGNDGQTRSKADPDPDALPAEPEAKPDADAEADHPLADCRVDHGDSRVVEAAQHARADHLRAIDDLEDGRDGQEADRERNDRPVERVALVEE